MVKIGTIPDVERDIRTECHQCFFKKLIPGDAHISCGMPDNEMTGDEHGINSGWFFYPFNFDPVWKTKQCGNFLNRAVCAELKKKYMLTPDHPLTEEETLDLFTLRGSEDIP